MTSFTQGEFTQEEWEIMSAAALGDINIARELAACADDSERAESVLQGLGLSDPSPGIVGFVVRNASKFQGMLDDESWPGRPGTFWG